MEKIEYSKKVMQHFLHPKHFGEIKDADAVGEAGNIKCGDIMHLYIKVADGKISDAKFKTLGCAAAIASSDVMCELVIGKTIEKASKVTNKDIVDYLGVLPTLKLHCSVLGMETLHDALKKLRK
ncbi:MAG: iron-sulfur cluster assembly scaffold protein [Candidatus Nanoarchaeia archaeon]|nr:iron-sulfur cluster assembly scaffold protein [Candidatus Nanoarchaeia archaeon]MDD5239245.1 iron-sulfur cluster assembly scaffold protein [Candidatus Nanoarchaeia archaeon]